MTKKQLLDEEFDALELQIREKIKAAGELIKEANELAKPSHGNLRQFTYDDRLDWGILSPLFGSVDQAGWSTSSLAC